MMGTIKTNLKVGKPEVVVSESSGRDEVFKTSLTHPGLNGELYFYHGTNDLEERLQSIQNTLVEDVTEIIGSLEALLKSRHKK